MQLVVHSPGLRNAVKLFNRSGSATFENPAIDCAFGSFSLSNTEERAVTKTFMQKEKSRVENEVVTKAYWI
ncbi:hypothetical protein [Paenibacillus sp. MBLB4367]|uniref:hypothetical protein n=1 Tax=Paenibacillus sp. MBLB4367 TaxID=3384767 RepID=UPI0039083740